MHPLRVEVEKLLSFQTSQAASEAIVAAGGEGLNAVKEGMRDSNWRLRMVCTEFLDHFADKTCVDALLMALKDGKQDVRRRAFHSIACQTCKKEPLGLDLVPILLDAISNDRSLKVRRRAAGSLGMQKPDRRAVEPVRAFLAEATDQKLKRLLTQVLSRHEQAPAEQTGACLI